MNQPPSAFELFLMGYTSVNLDTVFESGFGLFSPIGYRRSTWPTVKRRVQFDRVEHRLVMLEPPTGRQTRRIDPAFPVPVVPARTTHSRYKADHAPDNRSFSCLSLARKPVKMTAPFSMQACTTPSGHLLLRTKTRSTAQWPCKPRVASIRMARRCPQETNQLDSSVSSRNHGPIISPPPDQPEKQRCCQT